MIYRNDHLYAQDFDGNVAIADLDFKIQQQFTVDNISSTQRNIRNCSLLATDKGIYASNSKNIALLKDGKVQSLLRHEASLEMVASIKNICYAHDTLYGLFYDGIYLLDEKKKGLHKIYNGHFCRMALDDKGVFWLISDNKRLYLLDLKHNTGLVSLAEKYPALTDFTEPDNVICDNWHHVIIVYDNMLLVWNTDTKMVVAYPYKNKIISCNVTGEKLLVCTDGYIDMYLFNGLTHAYSLSHKYYNFRHSLYEDIIDITASVTDLYLSTSKGIIRMALNNTLKADSIFHLNTQVASVNHNGAIDWAPDLPVSFDYSTARTTFNTSCISLTYGSNIIFHYYLEGIDESWQQSTSPAISYRTLPPGSYVFHLIAGAENFKLQSKEFIYQFIVKPLWWQRGIVRWSVSLMILSVLFFIGMKIAVRRKSKQLHIALLGKKASDLQLGTLQSQMNPHFIFNALTSVQSYLKRNKNELATIFLLEFTSLIRLYIEFSRKRLISLCEEIDALKIYTEVENKRFGQQFHVAFQEDLPAEKMNQIYIPPMIIQPFVENAINHGLYHKTDGEGMLTISFSATGNDLVVKIDDNGVGRLKASEINNAYHKAPSRGNQIVNERIKILAEQNIMYIFIHIADKVDGMSFPAGTTVIITFRNILNS